MKQSAVLDVHLLREGRSGPVGKDEESHFCFAFMGEKREKIGMPNTQSSGNLSGIPEGYSAIPVQESEMSATMRLCVLTRDTPDPVTGNLILLRDLPDAMVYLGCLTDSGGRLREWVELWIQNLDGLAASLPSMCESISNHGLDERWTATARSFQTLHREGFIQTVSNAEHPLPVFLDLSLKQPVHPSTSHGKWQLCQDDAALHAAGLPPYSTSLFRYLYQPSFKEDGLIPVVAGSPVSPATRPPSEMVKGGNPLIPFNPQGGLMVAQNFPPIGYEDFADLLGGKPWKGYENGKQLIRFGGIYESLGDPGLMQQGDSHFFLGGQGRAGRFVEGFHLKLQLLYEVLKSVRGFVEQQQLPFLNLSAESFRVSLGNVGAGLPYLWTSNCTLVMPGQAHALPLEASDLRYFIRARAGGASVYQPEGISDSRPGTGSFRLRQMLPPDNGRIALEGTLVMQEAVDFSPNDLIWIRVPLSTGRLDLYGHLHTGTGMAPGETRLRTVPQMFTPEVIKALRAAEGVSFARSPFEIVPVLSTPCDLYALGVLAVRTFLVNPQTTLAIALDEMLSLARQAGSAQDAGETFAARVGSVLNADARFANSLSPNRLSQEPMEPKSAYELLPPELWHNLLALIARLFPGVGPDSYCKDFGDAPPLALENVFNKPIEDLQKLLIRSRSLIFIDWHANREVHSAIRDIIDRQKL